MISILGLLEFTLGRPVRLVVHEDNTQCISAVKRGYSTALKHLPRHCRMDLGFVNDVIAGVDEDGNKCYWSEIVHEPTATQKGDIFTKSLDRAKFLQGRQLLGMR